MKRTHGFGLIEVMVALLVIAIGVMGLMSLQTYTLREAKEAEYYNRANFLAKDMFERMRGNFAGVSAATSNYTIASGSAVATPPADCSALAAGSTCDAAAMVNWDLYQWCKQLEIAFSPVKIDPAAAFTCDEIPAAIVVQNTSTTGASITFTRLQAQISINVPLEADDGSDETLVFTFVSEI